jgi:2-methylisocitrate lyase-like PEP mutase family enzyme
MSTAHNDIAAKAETFRRLHQPGAPLLMANPWDAGSARLLSSLGFVALGTTSAGLAHSLGLPDGARRVDRATTLANARGIVEASDLPVSADLESCFAATAEGVAETIELAGTVGVVGGSIEDATGNPAAPILATEAAVERVAAAAQAARSLGFGFVLTARADNFLYGNTDLADTIDRLQRYAMAGADVLYAPVLPDLAAVREVCRAVDRPVNVLASPAFTVAELAEAGVARISLGSALSRAALGAVSLAAREILESGTFGFSRSALPYGQANELMSQGAQR